MPGDPFLARLRRATTQTIRMEKMVGNKITIVGTQEKKYLVDIDDRPTCTCPDYIRHRKKCKHIIYVLLFVLGYMPSDPVIISECWDKQMIEDVLQKLLFFSKKECITVVNRKSDYGYFQRTGFAGTNIDRCGICKNKLFPLSDNAREDFKLTHMYSCGFVFHEQCLSWWWTLCRPKENCPCCRVVWIPAHAQPAGSRRMPLEKASSTQNAGNSRKNVHFQSTPCYNRLPPDDTKAGISEHIFADWNQMETREPSSDSLNNADNDSITGEGEWV